MSRKSISILIEILVLSRQEMGAACLKNYSLKYHTKIIHNSTENAHVGFRFI